MSRSEGHASVMEQYVQLAVLGLGAAAAYALLSTGLVLINRASGVLNFSQGALATAGAYVFYELRVKHGWAYAPALIVSVLALAFVGALIYLLIMRPLRNAAVVVRIIATLAVLTVVQAIAILRYQDTIVSIPEALPQKVVHWGIRFPEDRLYLIGIALVLTVLLHLLATYTRFGLATRGVAENQRTAAAVGWSPDYVATINWALGSGLAALAGILIIPISSLSATSLTFLVVPALAVALLGGFSSFTWAFVGAVVLGMGQGALTKFSGSVPGLSDALPFALILVALLFRRKAIPSRGEVLHRLPGLGAGRLNPFVVGGIFVAGVLGSFFLPLEWVSALGVSVVVAIVLLSVVVVTGYAGQLSLGQYALAGVGALVAAHVVASAHWAFPIALVLGVLAAAAFGLVFGLPSLRSRGAALAIITLGMGQAVQSLVFTNGKYTGGAYGFAINSQSFFGINLDPILHPRSYTVFVLVWFALSVWVVVNLRRSRAGLRLIALRANERAATSLGVNVGAAKLYAFVVSAGLAGLGGVLLAFGSSSIVLAQGYDPLSSITAVMLALVGGVAHVSGSVFGGSLAAGGLPAGLIANHVGGSNGAEWLVLIGGVLVLLTLVLNPDGVAGSFGVSARQIAALVGRTPAARLKPQIQRRRRTNGSNEAATSAPAGAPNDVAPIGSNEVADMSLLASTEVVRAERRPDSNLTLSQLAVSFGGVRALRGVDLTIPSGQIIGLLGPNGSGKTTLIDGVTGYVRSSGQVAIGGTRLDHLPPHRRARAGVTRSFQSLELFDDVSVEENLRAAADDQASRAFFSALFPSRRRRLPAAVGTVVDEFQLGSVLHMLPKELSYGQRRLVAIARAVAAAPAFLLLDEPAAGLGSIETEELSRIVVRLAREWNIGILLIEHDTNLVLSICDRIAVLDFGEKIADATPAEIRKDPQVIAAYLGQQTAATESLPAEPTAALGSKA